MIYQWKSGMRTTLDAQIAGEVCDSLERCGGLTAKSLVDASRDERAPLHNGFEWDDGIAAEEWRMAQARTIINHITIVREEPREPIRAFFNVAVCERKYVSVDVAFKDAEMRDNILQAALKELIAFKCKYKSLSELSKVFADIDELTLL